MHRRIPILITTSVLVAAILSGCSGHTAGAGPAVPPASTASSPAVSPVSTARPAADAPLTCADLVSDAQIVAAMSGPGSRSNATVTPTSSADGLLTGEKAIEGAGGLSCSWTVGPDSSPGRNAVFTATVLPDAADGWTAVLSGDAPTPSRHDFGGVSAAADCGDPGCSASAPVGSSWVRIDLSVQGLGEGRSVYGAESTDTILTNAESAIASVFAAVQHATAAQLRFPSHPSGRAAPPACASYLKAGPLASAMGVESADYVSTRQPSASSDSIAGAAEHRIGTVVCDAEGSGSGPDGIARIILAPGQAWAVAALADDPASRGALTPTTLPGQIRGEHALTDCRGSGTPCTVVLSLGGAAIQIDDSTRSVHIAEAILAQAR